MNHFEPKLIAPDHIDINKALVFIFHNDHIIIDANESAFPIPTFTPELKNILTHEVLAKFTKREKLSLICNKK